MIEDLYKQLLEASQKEMSGALARRILVAAIQEDREAAVQSETIRYMFSLGFELLKAEYGFKHESIPDGQIRGDLLFALPDLSVVVAVETAYRNYFPSGPRTHNKGKKFHDLQAQRAVESAISTFEGTGVFMAMTVRNANNGMIVYEGNLAMGTTPPFECSGSWRPRMFIDLFPNVGSSMDLKNEWYDMRKMASSLLEDTIESQ